MCYRRETSDISKFACANRETKPLINVFFATASHPIDSEIDGVVGQALPLRQNGEKWKTKRGAYHLIFLVGPQHRGAFRRRFVLIHPHFGFLFLRRVFSLHEGGTQFHLGQEKE